MWNPCIIGEDDRFVYGLVDPLQEGEILFRFFVEAFGRQFDVQDYRWFKLHHPYSRNRVYTAREKASERFAAAICMLPFKYRLGREICWGSLCTGVVTHPDFRRLGLFERLNRMIPGPEDLAGSMCGVGFPNPAAFRGHLRAGWSHVADLRFYEKRDFKSRSSSAVKVERFDERYDAFCMEAVHEFDLCHAKDRRVLNWRYCDRPGSPYECYAVDDGRVEGLTVLKRFESQGTRKTHIMEFLALNRHAAKELFAIAEMCAAGSDLLNVWVPPGGRYKRFFEAAGFLPTAEASPVILRMHDGTGLPATTSPWFVFGDNDVY
ncbi:MAG: GNAT family N-acetyltransferase [Pseudomonadota bacterium]